MSKCAPLLGRLEVFVLKTVGLTGTVTRIGSGFGRSRQAASGSAVVAELVDALDLGSSVLGVRVRVSPTAPLIGLLRIGSQMGNCKKQRKSCRFQ